MPIPRCGAPARAVGAPGFGRRGVTGRQRAEAVRRERRAAGMEPAEPQGDGPWRRTWRVGATAGKRGERTARNSTPPGGAVGCRRCKGEVFARQGSGLPAGRGAGERRGPASGRRRRLRARRAASHHRGGGGGPVGVHAPGHGSERAGAVGRLDAIADVGHRGGGITA